MPDHYRDEPRDPRIPGELFRSTTSPASLDLAAALAGLDRATRNFNRRLGERPLAEERSRVDQSRFGETVPPAPPPLAAAEGGAPAETRHASATAASPRASFDLRMATAEREAREYLEAAKRRADSLVASMVGAVEQEAAELRRGAEEGIRARWQQVEIDAGRHVENARRVAEHMVAERQGRIAALSDGISGRATALTAGMDDADHVRAQFDAFVRALSITADRIAHASGRSGAAGELHELRERPRPSPLAA